MMQRRHNGRGESGFTLVELMVSLTVLSVAIAAAFTLAFSLMNGFRDHRRAVNVESTTRIVLDILASGARAASPGIINGQVWDPCTGLPTETIEVINSTTGPDELHVVHALGGAFASIDAISPQDISGGNVIVDDNGLFESGVWVPAVIIEPSTSRSHLVEVRASGVDPTDMEVRPPGDCASPTWDAPSYDAGSFIVRAVHVHYTVEPPLLLVDPDGPGALDAEVMAEGIEDLQIAVGVEDGIDTGSLRETAPNSLDEWFYNDNGDATAPLVSAGAWRALRISVIGVDSQETKATGTNVRPAVEDRAAAVLTDPFRRRVFSTTVALRNFEASQ